jgi:hypothetical protein
MMAKMGQAMPGIQGETISESELKSVCDEIYRDRFEIYAFNPGAGRAEAVLWMLLGCLISLLSIDEEELQYLAGPSGQVSYADALCQLLKGRTEPPFDPRPVVEELSKRVSNEQELSRS